MPRVAPLALGLVVLTAFTSLGGACAPNTSQQSSDGANNNTSAVVDCTGQYGTTPSPDGTYYITAFGCYSDQNGTHGDPGDNCIPGCLSQAQKSICSGMSGPACEESVNWYSADSARFGCMTRLRVTNPKNGKAVVVVVLDAGPSCFVEQNVNHAVLDMSTPSNLYLFGGQQGQADHALVDVEVVDGSTPLGPTTASSSSSSGSSSSGAPPPACQVNGVNGVCIDTSVCASMSGYVSTPGHCPGPASEECCTPPPSCTAGGVQGICIDTSLCTGTSTPGLCPGPASEQCCTP